MSDMKKPKSPPKKIETPSSAGKRAATTESVLEHAKRSIEERENGTSRTRQ